MNKLTKEKEPGVKYVGFPDVLAALPDKEFQNLTRSTIPLLAYWKKPRPVVRGICHGFGFKCPKDARIYFEYAVPSLTPRDYPSCSDVMLVSDQLVVAVEGKWSEPRYETVGEWLEKGSRAHREKVLRYWLGLIQPFAQNELKPRGFHDVVYQMLHRAASACAVPAENHAVVYQLFHASEDEAMEQGYYERDMEHLRDLIRPHDNLRFGVESMISLAPSHNHESLRRKLEAMAREERPVLIRNALATRNLFEFSSICFSTWSDE